MVTFLLAEGWLLVFLNKILIFFFIFKKHDETTTAKEDGKKSWITIDKEYVVRDQSLKRFRRVIYFTGSKESILIYVSIITYICIFR